MSGMYEDAFFDVDLRVERALGLAGGLSLVERDALLTMHEALGPSIRRSLRKAFPGTCVGRVEDAVQATGLAILERPSHFAEVVARGGISELKRQLTVVAWRALRGQLRKRGARLEDGDEEQLLAFAQPAGQELAAELRVGWAKAVRRAAEASGGADIEAVEAAINARFWTGQPDTVTAARTGVRREYINRGRIAVERELLGACGLR